jgi:hypothetical protein
MALKPGIAAALLSIETTQEVREAYDVLKQVHSALKAKEAARVHATGAIKVGSVVAFTGRYGLNHNGTIVRVNRTTASVEEANTGFVWRVPLGSLMPA